jgi:hypothetical protein
LADPRFQELAAAVTRATSVRVGLPRIDWDEVWSELGGIEVVPPALFEAAGRLWLLRLGEAIDAAPAMRAAEHFTLMAAPAQAHGPELLPFAENCRSRILQNLRDIARPAPVRLPIVLLARSADYVSTPRTCFPRRASSRPRAGCSSPRRIRTWSCPTPSAANTNGCSPTS